MNALTTCNACEAAPMAAGQERPSQPGYCIDCLAEMLAGLVVEAVNAAEPTYFLGETTVGGEVDVCRRGSHGGFVLLATLEPLAARAMVRELNDRA